MADHPTISTESDLASPALPHTAVTRRSLLGGASIAVGAAVLASPPSMPGIAPAAAPSRSNTSWSRMCCRMPCTTLLLSAIPPDTFFQDHDRIKQDLHFPITFGPTLATTVWNFVDAVLARQVIQPAVLDKFHDPLQGHFDTVFGPSFREQANALPQLSAGGRLMLRRAGYHLDPHRDPKRSMLTCLLYLARPGDSEAHGTQLFRVIGDREASYKQTYYPEADGARCELQGVVPFRPNTMLAFMNSRGAHGATIPADAGEGVERYTYQFYVAPENEALGALIRELPRERRTMWQNKNKLTSS